MRDFVEKKNEEQTRDLHDPTIVLRRSGNGLNSWIPKSCETDSFQNTRVAQRIRS